MKNHKILILVFFSIFGVLSSSISIFVINYFNPSWEYFLTENDDEQISSCAISEDGKYVAVGSGNDFLYLFNDDTRTPLWSYKMDDDVICVDISKNGRFIVACDTIGTILLFERGFPVPIWEYKGEYYSAVKISGDGEYIAFLNKAVLYLYSREKNSILWSYGFNTMDSCIDISGDGNEIVVGLDGNLYFFDAFSSSPRWQYDTGEIINSLVISENGDLIAMGGQNNRIDIFNNTGLKPFKTYFTGTVVRSLSISEDTMSIAAVCTGGCYLFSMNDDSYQWQYSMASDSSQVKISPNGNYVVGGDVNFDTESYYLHCFYKTQNIPLWSIRMLGGINEVAISKNGDSIGVVTQQYFYYINRAYPQIFEWTILVLNLNYIGLIFSACLVILSGFLWVYNGYKRKVSAKSHILAEKKTQYTGLKYCSNCMTSAREKRQSYCENCGSELID